MKLASAASARKIDATASADWGLDSFALVEAAGRACASALTAAVGESFFGRRRRIVALVGSGNNGADALVMIRALILSAGAGAEDILVVLKEETGGSATGGETERTPRGEALKSVIALGVATVSWSGHEAAEAVRGADVVLDGISGTGIEGALRGVAAEMARSVSVEFISAESLGRGAKRPLVVSVDVPSGIGDAWRPPMTAVSADLTLAIEPLKAALFLPYARPFAGRLVRVTGIFPPALLESAEGGDLVTWDVAARMVPPVPRSAYKHQRGVVEIRAGSPGSVGAAGLAAKGAQGAGAGLVRLVVDAGLRDVLAVNAGGAMVATIEEAAALSRFVPDCVLAGPGWGRSIERKATLDSLSHDERAGRALVLDADATAAARGLVFSGNTIFTPHPGEFAEYSLVAKEEILAAPDGYLSAAAAAANAVFVLKGHVTRIAAPDGRLAVVDGMEPILAMGGSGDVLAGLTAAIAARSARAAREAGRPFDPFPSAVAASALLAEAGRIASVEIGFCDPAEIAGIAGRLAADAWLKGDTYER